MHLYSCTLLQVCFIVFSGAYILPGRSARKKKKKKKWTLYHNKSILPLLHNSHCICWWMSHVKCRNYEGTDVVYENSLGFVSLKDISFSWFHYLIARRYRVAWELKLPILSANSNYKFTPMCLHMHIYILVHIFIYIYIYIFFMYIFLSYIYTISTHTLYIWVCVFINIYTKNIHTHIHRHTYGAACGAMVIAIGNGHGNTSSNPGPG